MIRPSWKNRFLCVEGCINKLMENKYHSEETTETLTILKNQCNRLKERKC